MAHLQSTISEGDEAEEHLVSVTDEPSQTYSVQTEGLIKGRALDKIRHTARERSCSELSAGEATNALRRPSVEEHSRNYSVEKLFEAMPDPYPHQTNYARIVIEEPADDFVEVDTLDACKKLRHCMEIREKWLSAHPPPPQDEMTADMATPKRGNLRRRPAPVYEIFEKPVPRFKIDMECQLVRGVMKVRDLTLPRKDSDYSLSLLPGDQPSPELADYRKLNQDEWDALTGLFPVLTFQDFVNDFNTVNIFLEV